MFSLYLDVYDIEDFEIYGEFYLVDVLWETKAICDKETVLELINQIYENGDIDRREKQDADWWVFGRKKNGDAISVHTVEITYMEKGIRK